MNVTLPWRNNNLGDFMDADIRKIKLESNCSKLTFRDYDEYSRNQH